MGKIASKNIPWVFGILALAVCGITLAALTHNPIASIVTGVVAGVVIGVALHFAYPPDAELDAYNVNARRRVAKLLDSTRAIQRMASKVNDETARTALESGCSRIPDLINKVQEREPLSVASTASTLFNTVSRIQDTLARYLDIQEDPTVYTDGSGLMSTGRQGFVGFDEFVIDTFRAVNDADARQFQATLAAIRPPDIPQLTQ